MYLKKEIIISFFIITISASNLYMPMIWLYVFLQHFLIPFLCDPDLQCLAKIKTNSLQTSINLSFYAQQALNLKVPCPHPLQWEAQIRYLLHAYSILFAGFLVWITKEKLLRELDRSVYGSAKDSLGHIQGASGIDARFL